MTAEEYFQYFQFLVKMTESWYCRDNPTYSAPILKGDSAEMIVSIDGKKLLLKVEPFEEKK
jgi:hypothetical protein